MAVVVKTVLGSHFAVDEITTHFRTYCSGWIGSRSLGVRAFDFDPWPHGEQPLFMNIFGSNIAPLVASQCLYMANEKYSAHEPGFLEVTQSLFPPFHISCEPLKRQKAPETAAAGKPHTS